MMWRGLPAANTAPDPKKCRRHFLIGDVLPIENQNVGGLIQPLCTSPKSQRLFSLFIKKKLFFIHFSTINTTLQPHNFYTILSQILSTFLNSYLQQSLSNPLSNGTKEIIPKKIKPVSKKPSNKPSKHPSIQPSNSISRPILRD